MTTPPRWSNKSVLNLANGEDPIGAITKRAREVVTSAMDQGWTGPPFEPIQLADLLGITVVPRDDVRDARTVPSGDKPVIEFNPSRPRGRMRYSLAHEIAHTLFEDWSERVRHRATYHELEGDDWQLEAVCNIAAAEFVMPMGSLTALPATIAIDTVLELRKTFDVSVEAVLIRLVRLTREPYAMFCASRIEGGKNNGRYRLDYTIAGSNFAEGPTRGALLPQATVLAECTSIGYTAKGEELWPGANGLLHVEAVGIPPYPGQSHPRAVGLLRSIAPHDTVSPLITYLRGDASKPHGDRNRIIAHIVNDETPNWGGAGFVNSILRAWPAAQQDFRAWARSNDNFKLGNTHFIDVEPTLTIANMIAQAGFGPSNRPRIRYAALEDCLEAVRSRAMASAASVHMPRIGCGQAGGKWDVVEALVTEIFSGHGISLFVYDLPDRRERQQTLMP